MKVRAKYSSDEIPEFPELKVVLSDPHSQKFIEIRAKVDTGFSGSLLIGLDDYTNLGFPAHENLVGSIVGRLASGTSVSVRASKGILKLSDAERIPCSVYTIPVLARPLIGRELLNLWRTVLDGQKGALEIET